MTAQLIYDEPWGNYTKSRALGSSALQAWQMVGRAQWSADFLESEAYADEEGPDNGAGAKEGGDYLDARLTGNKPLTDFVVKPEGMRFSTKEGIAWRDANASKTIISAKQEREILAAEPMARESLGVLLTLGGPISYQATLRGDVEGLTIQTRPDFVIDAPDMLVIGDLKYVGQIDKFARDWVGSRYEIQVAAGVHLARESGITKRIEFRFLLVESGTENPRCHCLRIPDSAMENAVRRLQERCRDIREVRDSPLGFVDLVMFGDLDLPGWAEKKLEGPFDA